MARQSTYEVAADLHQAMADPGRLAILDILQETGGAYVKDISSHVGLTQPSTSHKLAYLKHYGLVKSERQGMEVLYQLAVSREMSNLLATLHSLHDEWRKKHRERVTRPRAGEFRGRAAAAPTGAKRKRA